MSNCPRCFALVDGGWAYCGACGRPRIVEGLRAAVAQRPWIRSVWRGLVALFAIWLLVTVGVAFLREAKAVRDSRKLLEENRAQDAWSRLAPFLQGHPQHRQALFLCGKTTFRLDLRADAQSCLARLRERSPELAEDLRADFRLILTERAQQLGCDASSFEQLLAWDAELGSIGSTSVIGGLDRVVEACSAAQNYAELSRLATLMAERGQDKAMIEKGYVPAVSRAMQQARYSDAMGLARQAVSAVPGEAAAVEAVLDGERRKVSKTLETLRRLSTALRSDAQYWTGSSWCFPAAVPAAVQSARDGWGNPLGYSPIDSYGECYTGFTLTSFGSDGQETQGDGWSPASDVTCRYSSYWGESWQQPDRFWIPGD